MLESFKALLLSIAILVNLSSNSHALSFAPLATPKSVAMVGLFYGFTAGISNFLSAFQWNKHLDISDKTTALLQEIGGITAAIECLILGFMIPLMVYVHTKNLQTNAPDGGKV